MSLYRLTSEGVTPAKGVVFSTKALKAEPGAGGKSDAPPQTAPNSGLDGLAKYLPTETITLYIACVSANKPLVAVFPFFTPKFGYWLFLGLTPLLIYAGYLAIKKKTPGGSAVPKVPTWNMFAATVAFSVWALAVPGNGVLAGDSDAMAVVTAFGALFISTLLNKVAPFFE